MRHFIKLHDVTTEDIIVVAVQDIALFGDTPADEEWPASTVILRKSDPSEPFSVVETSSEIIEMLEALNA